MSKWLLEFHLFRGEFQMCKEIIQKLSSTQDVILLERLTYFEVLTLKKFY